MNKMNPIQYIGPNRRIKLDILRKFEYRHCLQKRVKSWSIFKGWHYKWETIDTILDLYNEYDLNNIIELFELSSRSNEDWARRQMSKIYTDFYSQPNTSNNDTTTNNTKN